MPLSHSASCMEQLKTCESFGTARSQGLSLTESKHTCPTSIMSECLRTLMRMPGNVTGLKDGRLYQVSRRWETVQVRGQRTKEEMMVNELKKLAMVTFCSDRFLLPRTNKFLKRR